MLMTHRHETCARILQRLTCTRDLCKFVGQEEYPARVSCVSVRLSICNASSVAINRTYELSIAMAVDGVQNSLLSWLGGPQCI